jgi:hypothetical protein
MKTANISVVVLATALLSFSATAEAGNIALNLSRTGSPSPLETDVGYDNPSLGPWYLVDGITDTGGAYWQGVGLVGPSNPWYQDYQQITVDFGAPKSFYQVQVWDIMGGPCLWYGGNNKTVEYWNGTAWIEVLGGTWTVEQISYYQNPVIYTFPDVTGSKVRFSVEPRDWVWVSEFAVLGSVPDPGSTLLLLGIGVAGMRAWKKRLR